jgi:hypothetical protein
VSILIGQGTGDAFTMTAGPRIAVGAGPIAVTFRDLNGDGINDLVVTNGQDGSISIVPGIGNGFFRDNQTTTLNLPGNPTLRQTTNLDTADGFALTNSGAIFQFDLSNFSATVETVFTSAAGREATFVDPMLVGDSTVLFIGNGDGTVELLEAFTSSFSVAATASAAGLTDVSEIQVFPVGDRFEIYATQAGSSVPFVLTFPNLSLGESGPTVQVAELFSTSPSAPATVAILITVPLTTESSLSSVPQSLPGSGVLFLAGANPDLVLAEGEAIVVAGGGGGMGDAAADGDRTEGDGVVDYIIGVEERLGPVRQRLRKKLLDMSQLLTPADEMLAALDQLFEELAQNWRAAGTNPMDQWWQATAASHPEEAPSRIVVGSDAPLPTDTPGPEQAPLVAARPEVEETRGLPPVQPRGLRSPLLFEVIVAGIAVCGTGYLHQSERRRQRRVRPLSK